MLSGLEADQRVLAAHGCYALTATTGLTAQNTLGVQDIHVIPAGFVKKQINAALEDIGADVVKLGTSSHSNRCCIAFTQFRNESHTQYNSHCKTGMLSSTETVGVIADALLTHDVATVVLDPVFYSSPLPGFLSV